MREFQTPKQVIGEMYVEDDQGRVKFSCKTLELPWRNNRRYQSCVPVGKYRVKLRKSKKHGEHLHIFDVPHRDYILIHAGNFHRDVKGCVLVGRHVAHIDDDEALDVGSSHGALMDVLGTLDITKDDEVEMIVENRTLWVVSGDVPASHVPGDIGGRVEGIMSAPGTMLPGMTSVTSYPVELDVFAGEVDEEPGKYRPVFWE